MIKNIVFMGKQSRVTMIFLLKILIGDLNAKVERENIFKPIIGNESLHQDSNNNDVRTVHSAT